MARCHRIGQDKDVTVYRLITDNTYEQNVFECSTRKQGNPSTPPMQPWKFTLQRFCTQDNSCIAWKEHLKCTV